MKRTLLLAGLALILAPSAFSQGSGAGLVGSPHDFTDNLVAGVATPNFEVDGAGTGWNGREEICRVCHVPHDHNRATQYGLNGMLWNHEVSSATYTLYSSATLDGAITDPDGHSKLCLGCHDGTVGIDTFDKYAGGNVFIGDYNAGFAVPGAVYGGGTPAASLEATHPISIVYDVTDTGLFPVNTAMASGTIEDYLEAGKVQCSTCHDVHDAPGESVAGTHLLRVLNNGANPSGLCLTCHDK